ncbi:leucine rich adaptor protein 1 [Gouania willdenowi]|uniref:Leucine rich adaptor protein 1-like n=1 Tax=Gouania willdenowi TaxID=441366 RepID=A0A8C5G1M3_GOUWI|nr:leucine rich adaptor protein 1-like [Gouania willdenowi]
MEESTATEAIPDLKDVEMKIGRKTPEGLLRWMRDEATSTGRGEAAKLPPDISSKDTGRKSLDEKIRKLKVEMAHLRSVDVKILQQLLAVHEGIEAVKWLLEERSTLTSRCSSLTSSQYSLGEGPETSWRGSWSSLQDPHDKLDNISVGSYLDTLADDMDEYCPSSSESVICSTTPLVSEATAVSQTGTPGSEAGLRSNENNTIGGNRNQVKSGVGNGVCNVVTETGNLASVIPPCSQQAKLESSKQEAPIWTKVMVTQNGSPVHKNINNTKTQAIKANGAQTGSPTRPNLSEKLVANQSPTRKPYKNGKIDMDTCKMNSKMHLEYDAHWRWVQSQEDVTFL